MIRTDSLLHRFKEFHLIHGYVRSAAPAMGKHAVAYELASGTCNGVYL